MAAISIATPFNIDLEFNASPIVKRGLAYGIDLLVLTVYFLLYHFVISGWVHRLPDGWALVLELIIYYFPEVFYFFVLEVLLNGRSVGKIAMGLRVVNINGGKASFTQYLIRAFFRSAYLAPAASAFILMVVASGVSLTEKNLLIFITIWMIVMALILLGMFLFYVLSKYGQRLGDKIANTLVIEDRAKADIHQTIYLEIGDSQYQPRYPEVMRLTDRDINGIRNLLDVKRLNADNEAYMSRIALRITSVLKITTDLEPYDFLAQLLRDYNYLTSR